MDVRLNSLRSVQPVNRSTVRSMIAIDSAGSAPTFARFINRTKTASVPAMKVGTPQTSCDSANCSCSARSVSSAAPESIRANTSSGVDAVVGEDARDDRAIVELQRLVVTHREQRAMHGGELLGELIANHYAGLQREDSGVLLGFLPNAGLAFLDMDLAERERDVTHLPVGAGGEAGEHMLVSVTGERAAVVPGD